MDQYLLPGDVIGPATSYSCGFGVYRRGDSIVACIAGRPRVYRDGKTGDLLCEIECDGGIHGLDHVIRVGDIVHGLVTRVFHHQAVVEVFSKVKGKSFALREECLGVIRIEDVRKFDVDRIELDKCFRPGDVVRCRVISMGDSKYFYLGTAENELGVLLARSEEGEELYPINWEEMETKETKKRERRKCAKP